MIERNHIEFLYGENNEKQNKKPKRNERKLGQFDHIRCL